MGTIKNERELRRMKAACRVSARVLREVSEFVKPGVTTREIDEFAAERIASSGGKSAFHGYRGYPRHVCISLNEEVVHGLGSRRKVRDGDLVSLDVGVTLDGFIGDNAATLMMGECGDEAKKLVETTRRALYAGISCAKSGNPVADISKAIQETVEGAGFSIVREFVGHGVGRSVHEPPQIPNFVDRSRRSPRLKTGMALAIEPMVNAGDAAVKTLRDRWTVATRDGKPSAHFEHTILVTDDEPEILTCPDGTT